MVVHGKHVLGAAEHTASVIAHRQDLLVVVVHAHNSRPRTRLNSFRTSKLQRLFAPGEHMHTESDTSGPLA